MRAGSAVDQRIADASNSHVRMLCIDKADLYKLDFRKGFRLQEKLGSSLLLVFKDIK